MMSGIRSKKIQSNTVITTSVYTIPSLLRKIFCGTNSIYTVNCDIIILGYYDTGL